MPELQAVEVIVDGVVLGTFPASSLIETPFGYRLDCEEITGYPYTLGEELTVEVRAIFEPGGDILTVGAVQIPQVPCFVLGTQILTPQGYVAVETLTEGSRVVTRDHGVQVVWWAGKSTLPVSMLKARRELRPIRISAGALGVGQPSHDLLVSRQHRILVRDWRAQLMFGEEGGILAPALSLINDTTVRVEPAEEDITYVHIAFSNHDVVYANGVEAESFHPFAQMVDTMSPDQRAELFAVFPELEQPAGKPYASARVQVKAREGRVL